MSKPVENLQRLVHQAMGRLKFGLTNYRHPLRQTAWKAVTYAAGIGGVTTPLECTELYNFVSACEKVPGDLAEAGVYRGFTSAVMLQASRTNHLHLFDTFEGLPDSENQFHKGEYEGPIEQVKRNLAKWKDRTSYHPGIFPDSAKGLESLRFSFVHLDLDLYEGTLAGLSWFWPRLHSGGAILSHDYPLSAGVVRAFGEFFDSSPTPVFPLSGHSCIAIKP